MDIVDEFDEILAVRGSEGDFSNQPTNCRCHPSTKAGGVHRHRPASYTHLRPNPRQPPWDFIAVSIVRVTMFLPQMGFFPVHNPVVEPKPAAGSPPEDVSRPIQERLSENDQDHAEVHRVADVGVHPAPYELSGLIPRCGCPSTFVGETPHRV